MLTSFYGVSATRVPIYGLAFSVGNLAGPLLLGPLFDSLGRKKMISGTYLISGVLLAVSAWLFDNGDLTANSQTSVWVVIFFFASAGASAAYLTVSETWPIEIRSEAIAVFFTIGTIFGAIGPAFYGWLIGDGSSRTGLFIGYLVGAAIMIAGGVVELLLGINAEGKSLEDITKPLTAADQPSTIRPSSPPTTTPAEAQLGRPGLRQQLDDGRAVRRGPWPLVYRYPVVASAMQPSRCRLWLRPMSSGKDAAALVG